MTQDQYLDEHFGSNTIHKEIRELREKIIQYVNNGNVGEDGKEEPVLNKQYDRLFRVVMEEPKNLVS